MNCWEVIRAALNSCTAAACNWTKPDVDNDGERGEIGTKALPGWGGGGGGSAMTSMWPNRLELHLLGSSR